MVVMAAMMICLGASAIDKIVKKVEMTGEVTSLEALKSATFMLQNGDVVLYTPSGWDIKVAAAAIATEKTDNGGFFALTALDDHYLIPVFNIDKTRRTFWAGNQSVNAQPGGNVIFGLDGDNAQHGQDGPNLAVWDVTYKEGEGFAFHCVGRNIYIGHDGSAARPVEAVTYWKAFTGFNAGYDVAAVEATAASVESALKVTDASATFASAKAAYEADKVADGALDKYVAAINAAIDVVNTCEQVNKTYAAYKLSTLGAAAVKDVVAKYNAGEYKDVAALDAAYLEAVKSQNCDGADMTGAIVNPSFELGNANGWTYAASDDHGAKENSNGTYTMSNNDGKYVFNIWPKGNAISQTIEGLPNGTYKLQAVIATDGGKKVQLNANDKNVQIDATGKETGVEGEVEFEVTDGKATIGAEGVDESWYKVDNFRLTLVKAAAVVPEKDAWYNQINFAAKDYADPNATYTDGVDFPDAPWAVDGEGNGAIKIVSNAKKSQSHESQFFMQIADLAGGKFNKNDKVILKYKAKAESSNADLKEIQAGGGFHGNYAGNQWKSGATGATIKVGEWTDIETELTITNTDVTNYSLDLTYDAAPITYYFDDFSFEYVKGKDDWYLNNKIYAKDFTKGDEAYENGTVFPAAPFKDGAVQVVSDANAEVDHGSQIFFEIPESLRGGEVELTMKVKASKEISVATALHSSADGNGWSGNPAGDKVDFKVGEWTEITRVLNTDCKDGKDNPIAYYVLNLSDNVGKEAITYQFDDLSIKKYYAPVEWGDLVEVPVEGTLVTEKDWTQETSFPYWSVENLPEGCTRTIENGLVIENTKTDGDPWANQMFTLDGLTFEEGKEYVLRYTLKINGEGDIRADVGPWGTNLVKAPDTQTLENGYRQVVFGIGPCAQKYTGAHAIWQSRKFLGKIIIEKVELFDITPDYAAKDWSDNIVPNGDLATDDMSAFILKNNDVENPEMLLAEKNKYGEIGIETAALPAEGGNDYDAQFFVRLPYVLPQGTLFNLEFDLYAEELNTLAIQAHGEPGQWKGNMSSVTTNPDPAESSIVHYQKYLSAPADMRTIAFNLAVAKDATYGFSNIKVQIVNDDKATIEEATATADATTLWAETLALNEACYAGRIAETEGCTEASVKALTDAIAAGKAALAPAEGDPAPTKESLTAAAKAITDAIAGLKKDAPALADTDLTKEMFFTWTAVDATAEKTTQAGCDYNVGTSTGMPYGDGTVNEYNYADLSAYDHLAITATEGEPRLLFNRAAQDDHQGPLSVELPRDYGQNKYEAVVDNGDGSKTYVINLKAIVEKDGYAHLHAIKANGWGSTTTVTEMKLFVGESKYTDVLTGIADVETAGAVKDGKYFINGQIVIVKNGVKYNAAGVAIK